ncbi:MAG: hypoxanthine phosphoribosyltransferase, partial [Actinomycetota bacterium]|nr:hypoxanthine phosphoribosyltransferase [Actinomycetota bacterium]
SFVFLADLVRELDIPFEVDFVRARSYGKGTRSSGAVEITKDVETNLSGRHVVVVEDIADTGLTMEVVVERIRAGHPASVRRCALLVREGNCSVPVEYGGLAVGEGFVVGYGIDYAESYRGLRDIQALARSQEEGS